MDIKRAQELKDRYSQLYTPGGVSLVNQYQLYEIQINDYREFIQAIADNNIEGDIELIARKILEI
jgi:membrane protease subunit (stomatin/prohibitin family)